MVLGLGSWEFVLIALALLILFGPEHAPGAIRTLGRWQTRIRRTLEDLEQTLEEETEELEAEGPFEPSQPRRPPEAEAWTLTEPDERHAQKDDDEPSG